MFCGEETEELSEFLKLTHLESTRTPSQASIESLCSYSYLLLWCLLSKEYYSMSISGLSMQIRKWDPNNEIYMIKVAPKQAVLCGFIFLSWFCIFGAITTKDKLCSAQTPEMTKLTYASVGKNNVMGVRDKLFFE